MNHITAQAHASVAESLRGFSAAADKARHLIQIEIATPGTPANERAAKAARAQCLEFCTRAGARPCFAIYGDRWSGDDATCAAARLPGANCQNVGEGHAIAVGLHDAIADG